jgi:hypothetical protein
MSLAFKKTASEKAMLKVAKRKFNMEKRNIPAYSGKKGYILGLTISTSKLDLFGNKDKTVFIKLNDLLKMQETVEALSFGDKAATA